LFEVRPDVFPDGRLTDLETHLWVRWYQEQDDRQKQPK